MSTYIIVDGPSKDFIIDALKYSFDRRVFVQPSFKIIIRDDQDEEHTIRLMVFRIFRLEYEDDSNGDILAIKALVGGNDFHEREGIIRYSTKKRNGFIEF